MKKRSAVWALLVAVCLLAAGTALAAGGTTKADTTFSYASENTIVTEFDPAVSYSNEIIAMNNVYEQLTRYNSRTNKVTPLLATSWKSSAGGKKWTFQLRKGVVFHTGRPLTAQAARAAILRTKKLKSGASYIWDAVKSIATPNAQTLVFTLKYPAPLDLIASSGYAAYIYDTKAAGSANLHAWFNKAHDAGTGPYVIASWSKGQENELRLTAFKGYWGGWKGAHYTDVLFKHVPTPTTRAQLVQSGGVTYTDRLSPQLFASMKGNSAVKTTQGTSFQNLIAFLNTASGPLTDTHVRQAIAAAIDYKGIVAALKGSVVPASGFIPKGLIGYTPGLGYTKNLARAKSLLAQAGYGPGKQALSLDLTIANGDADEQLVATIIKADLAALNVKVQVQALEWTTQWNKAKSKDPAQRQDIFVMYWWPDYADPYSWFINLFHSADPPYFNMSYLNDKAVDTSIDKLEALTATRRSAAVADYKQLQHRLISQAVAVPLYVQKYERVFAKSVGGYVDNPAYPNVVFVYDLRPTS